VADVLTAFLQGWRYGLSSSPFHIRHSSFGIRIRHSTFAIRHSSFLIPHSSFRILGVSAVAHGLCRTRRGAHRRHTAKISERLMFQHFTGANGTARPKHWLAMTAALAATAAIPEESMFASVIRTVALTLILMPPTQVFAGEKAVSHSLAPSKAVADAWAREQGTAAPSKALTALQVSYVGLQGLDVWSTIAARNAGASEVNPLMAGGYVKGTAFKAAMGAGTMLATRAMAKKNKKAAVVTMVVLNGVTAAVVANNLKNTRR
jgi:hypothetical protein